jgi:ubiquinone/menaquinone biosynthesis C-methylase UbiE
MHVRFRVPEMEGRTAYWYARQRGTESQLRLVREQATQLTALLPAPGAAVGAEHQKPAEGLTPGTEILEVAPGPGYLAVELARRGYAVTGLDISHTMVEIATEHARRAGVAVAFQHGDVTRMPFEAHRFDLVVCQAAFKNFVDPVRALDEMHRVLRPGGTAVIQDLNRGATRAEIAAEVRRMQLAPVSAAVTRFTLGWLRRRAYTPAAFRALAEQSAFRGAEVRPEGIGLEVRLRA